MSDETTLGTKGPGRLGSIDLSDLAWPVPGLPASSTVLVATSQTIRDRNLAALAPDDPSGARGLLLAALSSRFGVDPDSIDLGRPKLGRRFRCSRPARAEFSRTPTSQRSGRRRTTGCWVSLSRTDGLVAVAFGFERIGVDVERMQSPAQASDLLTLFHPRDRLRLDSLTTAEIGPTATAVWTRIEALLKLRGTGLRVDPAAVRVTGGRPGGLLPRTHLHSSGCDAHGSATALRGTSESPREPNWIVSVAWR